MSTSPLPAPRWTIAATSVSHRDAVNLLRLYFTEMASRYFNRTATDDEVDAAQAEDPSHDLAPPSGLFLLARHDDTASGCVGLRLLTPEIAELKRMFVHPAFRGLGGGSQLLTAAERAGRALGAAWIRLDTRHDLVEARSLYARHGYTEIPAYNDAPYADHWFEKPIV